MTLPRVVAVVGATATGKSTLALELAAGLDGEIINADSRQVYRGMDIGTAKPTPAEQARVPHHLIDILEPDESFSLGEFVDLARAAIAEVLTRGRLPVIVGGSGQYVWALLEAWDVPRVPPDARLREELADRPVEALLAMLREIDPEAAERVDAANSRRIVRAIEVARAVGRGRAGGRGPRTYDERVIGLRMDRARLHRRIDGRVEGMIAGGLKAEVEGLLARGVACTAPALGSMGYREMCAHLRGDVTLAEAAARMKTETHRLARMQHTWFRDDDTRIHWLDAEAPTLVADAAAYAGG